LKLQGKTAIVTGAASGIGKATAIEFAKEGANIVIVDLNEPKVTETAMEIEKIGVQVVIEIADVCDSERINQVVEHTIEKFGAIDIVVNCAGGSARLTGKITPFSESEQSTWEWVLKLNLLAPMIMNRAVIPHMIKSSSGKIINIGSVAGVNGLPNMVDYSAAKGGVIAMTHALAKEVGPYGINVNCISPGSIATRPGAHPQTFLKRPGEAWEVAKLIAFLASNDSDFITGQNYLIDGGRCISTNCY
jgi:NAD(P)-dependent dehydrogenase (short-subunit alcohol dehydrogenase family)